MAALELWLLVGVLLALSFSGSAALESASTQEFDVRPGGEVHSFSQSKGGYTCTFTYAAQGGTNEQWQMSTGISEDKHVFSCSIWRPQGKSYLFFTQFKADVQGAKIEYSEAYSQAAAGGQKDIALNREEYEVSETAVTHKPGVFRSQLCKLVMVARSTRSEL
ncbi:myeloid-derived growth factor [Microcaecilia unicolor]|uniref:Myeloid-derived growth factor n=1 Tax=Microcaecilia unicolor TaxID=1415580 RepID=A0A6P7Z3E1_9AMPH|nr:myeloid-derived growth factor [Microcaecilia unicolor]